MAILRAIIVALSLLDQYRHDLRCVTAALVAFVAPVPACYP